MDYIFKRNNMENKIDRLIFEAKKKGKRVNPWAICTASIGDKIGDTKRSDWSKSQMDRYEKCVMDVKKKSNIKEHHGEDWDPEILDMSVNTFLDKLKKINKEDYDCIEDIITKHNNKIVNESMLNEIGGYDDKGIYASHAGSYMGKIKDNFNQILNSLESLNELTPEVLDDRFRKFLNRFLSDMETPLGRFVDEYKMAEKSHIKNLGGDN